MTTRKDRKPTRQFVAAVAKGLRKVQRDTRLVGRTVLDTTSDRALCWSYLTCHRCGRPLVDGLNQFINRARTTDRFLTAATTMLAIHNAEVHGLQAFEGDPAAGRRPVSAGDLRNRLQALLDQPIGGGTDEHSPSIKAQSGSDVSARHDETRPTLWWWLAINGPSCSASAVALPAVIEVKPTPQLLIGFRSRDEQVAAQELILRAPISTVRRFLCITILARIFRGEVISIRPATPEPPTHGQTLWLAGADENSTAEEPS